MKKPLSRLLAALTVAALAALGTITATDDTVTPNSDTAWGAPATTDDTGWGTPPTDTSDATGAASAGDGMNTITVTLDDTAWG